MDPFWSVLKLRAGLARLANRFPPLQGPTGALSAPTFLAQAMEDEKDGALGDRLSQTLAELSDELEHLDVQFTDQVGENLGTHTKDSLGVGG